MGNRVEISTSVSHPDWSRAETVVPEGKDSIQYIAKSKTFLFVVHSDGISGHIVKHDLDTCKPLPQGDRRVRRGAARARSPGPGGRRLASRREVPPALADRGRGAGGGRRLPGHQGRRGGTITYSGIRFGTPVLDCPDGDTSRPLGVAILLEARNDGREPAVLASVTAQLVIVTSALPAEIGFASSRPATALPASLPAGRTVTVRVDTTLLCQNGAGDAARFYEWSGRLTLATAAGAVNVETADRMVVNIP